MNIAQTNAGSALSNASPLQRGYALFSVRQNTLFDLLHGNHEVSVLVDVDSV